MRGRGSRGRQRALAALLVVLLAAPAAAAEESELIAGIRQVQEGDYEGAVVTLEGALARLETERRPDAERARACLYLGIAHVALDDRDAARRRFRQALGYDAGLRLTPDRFSPKVIAIFEEARGEVGVEKETAPAKRSSRTPLVLLGAGAAAAGVALVATSGGGDSPGGGSPSFSGARFTTPVLVCPDGAFELVLPVAIQLTGDNPADRAVTILAVTAVLIIVESPAVPSEIGFASNLPASVSPASVGAGGRATLRVDTSLLCGNGVGDASRFNEWIGRVTLDTSAGVFAVETADRLRVNIP